MNQNLTNEEAVYVLRTMQMSTSRDEREAIDISIRTLKAVTKLKKIVNEILTEDKKDDIYSKGLAKGAGIAMNVLDEFIQKGDL